jgi:hypothetical protein
MGSNNNHKAITNLAMPERQIPVLIDSTREKAEGFVASTGWSDKDVTFVQRLLPTFVDGLRNPRKRREIEKEHGSIRDTEWNRLREMLALIDRLNAGDWSPIVTTDVSKALDQAIPTALLDSLGPEGWFLEDEPGTGKMKLRSASGAVRGTISMGPLEPTDRKVASVSRSGREGSGKTLAWKGGFRVDGKTAPFALSEAFTAGLSKTRFVVWWSVVVKKFVPGLYCPDVMTALYALAMWSSGTAGGWAICQRCGNDYPRSRAKQLYCGHKCQVAAAMQRMREKQKSTSTPQSKASTVSKKRTERN